MGVPSRRDALHTLAALVAGCAIPAESLGAPSKTAVLVASPGTIGPNLEGLAGMPVCAGAAGSTSDILLRKRGALAINVRISERATALRLGVCKAILFVASDKDINELKEEIKVFLPELSSYEVIPFPTQ